MSRTYQRDGYTLKQVEHPDATERDRGRCYQVIHDDLGCIGTVGTYQQRMERGPKRVRYVTARWYVERWWGQLAIEPQRWRTKHFTGPGEARPAWPRIRHL